MNNRKELMAEYTANGRNGEQDTLPLFVYGTLLPGFGNHHLLVRNRCVSLGSATVKGFELRGYPIPCAQFSSLPEAEVVGELYAFPEEKYQDILKVIDRLEAEGSWYCRLRVTVQHAGETVEAWMYVVTGMRKSGQPYFDYRQMDSGTRYASTCTFDEYGKDEDGLTEEDYR